MAFQTAQDEPLRVAIVGGGIVGLVLAAGLIKRGVQITVYEQARSFRELGAGIAFTSNAIKCMEEIDPRIPKALRSSGSVRTSNGGEKEPNDFLRWVDGYERRSDAVSHGLPGPDELLYQIDAGYRGFEGCRRDQFLEALVKLIPPDVVKLRKRLERLDYKDGGSIVLEFTDGTSEEADAGKLRDLSTRLQIG
jgi:salicylate hydroxylase